MLTSCLARSVFLKGAWNVDYFIFSYLAPAVFVVLFIGWKILKRTKFLAANDVDLVTYINDASFDDVASQDIEGGKVKKMVHKTMEKLF